MHDYSRRCLTARNNREFYDKRDKLKELIIIFFTFVICFVLIKIRCVFILKKVTRSPFGQRMHGPSSQPVQMKRKSVLLEIEYSWEMARVLTVPRRGDSRKMRMYDGRRLRLVF